MSLMKWSPFFFDAEHLDKIFDEMHALAPRHPQGIVPPIDMYETDTAVVVETPVAGVNPQQIEISIENNHLFIKGTTERKTEVDEKNYYRKEVRYGSVFRQVALPTHVDESKTQAHYENGVLKIVLPKAEPKKSIKVEITQ